MQFSLRDVLWLTLVSGLAIGWFVDHDNLKVQLDYKTRWESKAESLTNFCRDCGWTISWNDGRHEWQGTFERPDKIPAGAPVAHGVWGGDDARKRTIGYRLFAK